MTLSYAVLATGYFLSILGDSRIEPCNEALAVAYALSSILYGASRFVDAVGRNIQIARPDAYFLLLLGTGAKLVDHTELLGEVHTLYVAGLLLIFLGYMLEACRSFRNHYAKYSAGSKNWLRRVLGLFRDLRQGRLKLTRPARKQSLTGEDPKRKEDNH